MDADEYEDGVAAFELGTVAIAEALTAMYGPKCREYVRGCPTCDLWKLYEEFRDRVHEDVETMRTYG